jgi:D-alanyl-D-alanine dipeptidase
MQGRSLPHLVRFIGLVNMTAWLVVSAAVAAELPADFVFLADVDPTIIQDMRYAGGNNFYRKALPGYNSARCVLQRSAASALKLVQADLSASHLSLKVLDCYRPARAVRAMVEWVRSKTAESDSRYFPRVEKSELIAQGYIASRSGHSTGSVVDLTLVDLSAQQPPQNAPIPYRSCISGARERNPDGIDMGTSFDCFDPMSATASREIGAEQKKWRSILVAAMAKRGFSNYAREWWHFSTQGGTAMLDFVIPAESHPSGDAPHPVTAKEKLEGVK